MMGGDCANFMRQNRRKALKESDCVLMLGCMVDFRLDYGRTLPKRTPIIAVNRCKVELGRNTDMFWKATVSSVSDPALFFLALAGELGGAQSCLDTAWVRSMKEDEEMKEKKNADSGGRKAVGHVVMRARSWSTPCT